MQKAMILRSFQWDFFVSKRTSIAFKASIQAFVLSITKRC